MADSTPTCYDGVMSTPHILLFDAYNLVARCFFACWPNQGKKDADGNWPAPPPNLDAVFTFVRSMTRMTESWLPDVVALVVDGGGCPYRVKVMPSYKAHRDHNPSLTHHRRLCVGLAKASLPIHILRQEGFEADDIMAHIAAKHTDCRVTIVTTDRDLVQVPQILGPRVTVYHPKDETSIAPSIPGVLESEYKAMVGDPSDNIPSVTGKITAPKLFADRDYMNKWLDSGYTRTEKLPRRVVWERNLSLITLLGERSVVPVPDVLLPDVPPPSGDAKHFREALARSGDNEHAVMRADNIWTMQYQRSLYHYKTRG